MSSEAFVHNLDYQMSRKFQANLFSVNIFEMHWQLNFLVNSFLGWQPLLPILM